MQRKLKVLRYGSTALFLAGCLAALSLVALGVGSAGYSLKQISEVLKGQGEDAVRLVVFSLRMPRLLCAIMVGACLSASGALLQAVMQNPLADPGIIGVSSGAITAATTVILVYPGMIASLPIFAFIGACLACVLIYVLAWKDGVDPLRIVLSGVAINTVLGAYNSFLQLLNSDNLTNVLSFMNGSLAGKSWGQVYTLYGYAAVGLILAFCGVKGANVLQLGDETAKGLGVNVNRVRVYLSGVAAFLAACTVSAAGMIGFVGLLVPHIARMFVGSNYAVLLPISALLGAVVLLAADIIGRTAVYGMEIPVGIVMAMVGGPFFLYMLRRKG